MRLDEDEDEMIRRAAEISGMTMSHFMLASAREKAEGILVEHALHLLDAAAWRRFTARLDAPPTAKPELARLFSEPDIFE